LLQAEEQKALEEVTADILKSDRQGQEAALLRAMDRNLVAQQKNLWEMRADIHATLPLFVTLTEEQAAQKQELVNALRESRKTQCRKTRQLKRLETKTAAETEKDSQWVIDLKDELRISRAASRKLAREIKSLALGKWKGKQHIVSSEDEETPSA
jgi:hypothetical protein